MSATHGGQQEGDCHASQPVGLDSNALGSHPSAERLIAAVEGAAGGIDSGGFGRDHLRVKVLDICAADLAAHPLPLRQDLDVCLLSGRQVDVRELIDIGTEIAVDRDGVVSRCDIAIESPVGFRYPCNLTVQPEIRAVLGLAWPATTIESEPRSPGWDRRDHHRARRQQLDATRRSQQKGGRRATPRTDVRHPSRHSQPRGKDQLPP